MPRPACFLAAACLAASPLAAAVDLDGDQLSDVWELVHGASSLSALVDTDGDGQSNLDESLAGTDPFSPASRLEATSSVAAGALLRIEWPAVATKRYTVQTTDNLVGTPWTSAAVLNAKAAGRLSFETAPPTSGVRFHRISVEDVDTDGDGISDWEERASGFNPERRYTEGLGTVSSTTDLQRLQTALRATTNTVTLGVMSPFAEESWGDPAAVVVRRTGRVDTFTVLYSVTGTASAPADFNGPLTGALTFPVGVDERVLEYVPVADTAAEGDETIVVTLLPGTGYTLSGTTSATLTLRNSAPGSISEASASRFLHQTTYGPTTSEIASVRALGFEGWLDSQFGRPQFALLPVCQEWFTELYRPSTDPSPNTNPVSTMHRMDAWWRAAMAEGAEADPLRQRVTFALSQVFVVSDRMDSIRDNQRALADYWDTLGRHAFGNYRELLEAVTLHPMMGRYLSHYRNRRADPALNRYPDENYAREVMQLFTIGLWELNPDGTRRLSDGTAVGPDGEVVPAGSAIPTYGQTQVEQFARVFTGLSASMRATSTTDETPIAATGFFDSRGLFWFPMRMFDGEHDLAPKTLLNGVTLPARTATSSTSSLAGTADLEAALDNLFNHPNVGPFFGRLLIQRLVTSNPSPAYVSRVTAAFNNNGAGVRGDMRAVLKAILLDPEARTVAAPGGGMVREPYTRFVAMARALAAAPQDPVSAGGRFRNMDGIDGDFLQRPQGAPSVFNFYSPEHQPPGLRDLGLVSPEMQIVNSVTSISLPNRISTVLNVSGVGSTPAGAVRLNPTNIADDAATTTVNESTWNIRYDETPWIALGYGDVDALVAAIDRTFCSGMMTHATFRAITRAVNRLDNPATGSTQADRDRRATARYRVALHLALMSPDSASLR